MNILVLGGRGYLGSKVVKSLNGKIKTFDRKPGPKNHIQGDITNQKDLDRATKGMDIVINCIGLSPLINYSYEKYYSVHTKSVKNLIKSCKNNKVKKLIHISALGAEKKSITKYLKTKHLAERAIINSKLDYYILRPSVIYSKNNELVKTLQTFSKIHFMPKIPSRIQPIKLTDLVKIIKLIVDGKIRKKEINIAGPKEYTMHELALKITKKRIFAIPWTLCKPFIYVFSKLSNSDIYTFMQLNNTTDENDAKKYGCCSQIIQ